MKYTLVVCGGTFDHLHKGHKEFLRYALSISSKVLIGLTTDEYIKEKNIPNGIEDYKTREQSLEGFLDQEGARHRVKIKPINNIFIPKVWEMMPIESIIVSKDTYQSAKKINSKRKEQKKYPLKIEIVPLVKSDDNEYISSSRIRNGEINREGRLNINPLWLRYKLLLTKKLREQFKKPFGILLRTLDLRRQKEAVGHSCIVTVGDVTAKIFNDFSIRQNIAVVDFRVAREIKFRSFSELGFSGKEKIMRVRNPSGTLTPSLFKRALKIAQLKKSTKSIILKIEGEEDLSVLPLTLALPLGSLIFYGQPGKGIVKVEVTEKVKETSHNLVGQFKLSRSIEPIDK